MSQKSEGFLEETQTLIAACLADGVLDAGEVLKIGIHVAEKVGKVKDLSVEEKKDLVGTLVQEALQKTLSAEQYQQVGSTLVQVLPTVLEIAVRASRGDLSLGAFVETAAAGAGWLGCLKACFLTGPLRVLVPGSAKKIVQSVAAVAVTEADAAGTGLALEPEPKPEQKPTEVPDVVPEVSSSPATQEAPAPLETIASPEDLPSEEPQTAPNRPASPEEAP